MGGYTSSGSHRGLYEEWGDNASAIVEGSQVLATFSTHHHQPTDARTDGSVNVHIGGWWPNDDGSAGILRDWSAKHNANLSVTQDRHYNTGSRTDRFSDYHHVPGSFNVDHWTIVAGSPLYKYLTKCGPCHNDIRRYPGGRETFDDVGSRTVNIFGLSCMGEHYYLGCSRQVLGSRQACWIIPQCRLMSGPD